MTPAGLSDPLAHASISLTIAGYRPSMAVTSMSVTSKRVSRSLTNKWLGSYEIAEVKNKGNYRLRNPSTNNILAKMVNASRLKRYHQPSDEPEPPCKRSKNAETTTKSKKVPPCSWCVSCNGKVYICHFYLHSHGGFRS